MGTGRNRSGDLECSKIFVYDGIVDWVEECSIMKAIDETSMWRERFCSTIVTRFSHARDHGTRDAD